MSTAIDALPDLLTDEQATEFLQVAPGTLAVWRATKRHGLPYLKLGRSVRYRKADLEKWLQSRTVSPAAPDA